MGHGGDEKSKRFCSCWSTLYGNRIGCCHASFNEGGETTERGDPKFADHVELAVSVLRGEEKLGRKPHDLVDVVTDLALGASGTLAARSLAPLAVDSTVRRQAAAVISEGFRSLFNQPTAMAVVKRHAPNIPYWHATTRYSRAGNLQAVLDELFDAHVDSGEVSCD